MAAEQLRSSGEVLRAFGDYCSDRLTAFSGTWTFIAAHLLWWLCWLALAGDGNLLTLAVSLEAILLSCLVLMSQSRQAQADRQRQQLMEEHIDLTLTVVRHLEETNGAALPRP